MSAETSFSGGRPVALVTGAARRVGLASALALARGGCDVMITYRSSAAEAAAAVEQIRALGRAARAERLDLADLAETGRFAGQLSRGLPRLDVLVHNPTI